MMSLLGLDPATYQPHPLHASTREYAETNCYTDVLIEFVASCGHPPEAILGSTFAVDFEGDQWTFFKPAAEELRTLYGIDIHEMQPYRPLVEHIATQLGMGRTMAIDLDAYYLPDTAATSYRREHQKTSVIVEAIDPAAARLHYFHNGGLFELSGDDFRFALAPTGEAGGQLLPPYTEIIRLDADCPLRGRALRSMALDFLADAMLARPPHNPFDAFGGWLETQLDRIADPSTSDADCHALTFAAVRMPGAAAELAAAELAWLFGARAAPACEALRQIVEHSKALSFLLARRRRFSLRAVLEPMALAWNDTTYETEELLSEAKVTDR